MVANVASNAGEEWIGGVPLAARQLSPAFLNLRARGTRAGKRADRENRNDLTPFDDRHEEIGKTIVLAEHRLAGSLNLGKASPIVGATLAIDTGRGLEGHHAALGMEGKPVVTREPERCRNPQRFEEERLGRHQERVTKPWRDAMPKRSHLEVELGFPERHAPTVSNCRAARARAFKATSG